MRSIRGHKARAENDMEKYEYRGETYYYKDGKWLDSHFLAAPLNIVPDLNRLIVGNDDYKMMSAAELMKIIDGSKGSGNLLLAGRALEDALDKANTAEVKAILPRFTSYLRKQGNPRKAIDLCREYCDKYGRDVWSNALFTSIAAAYADTADYVTAKKFADRAFAFSGGKGSGELSSVYGRIHAALGTEFEEGE